MYLPFFAPTFVLGTTVADLGTWVFRFGSFFYLGSSYRGASDLIKIAQSRGRWRKQDAISLMSICAFMLGALFYIAGGVIGQMKIGDSPLMFELWVMGSLAFAVGSFIILKNVIGKVLLTKN